MGLFDFAANIGKSVFGPDDAEAAAKIKQDIEANNPGVENLYVELTEADVCILRGNCETPEAKEKAILMAGNMQGVSKVVAHGVRVAQPAAETDSSENSAEEQEDTSFEESTSAQYYTIESGDTLGAIAAKFLGSASKYTEIFEANREVIEDPNKIYPGQKIRIPS